MANTKGIPYFSHDCNSSGDKYIVRAEAKWGPLAYAWFFKTLELLRQEENFQFPLEDADVWANAIKSVDTPTYLDFILHSKLFQNDGENFWSESLKRRLKMMVTASENRSKAMTEVWEKKKRGINPPPDKPTVIASSESEPLTGIPLLASKIVLPALGFQLSEQAETSLRTQLAICKMPFDDFSKLFPNIPQETHELFKKLNSSIDSGKGEHDVRIIRTVNRQLDVYSFFKFMKKWKHIGILREAFIRIVRRGIQPGNDLPMTLEQYANYVQKDISEGKFNLDEKAATDGKPKTEDKVIKKLMDDGFYWIGNNRYAEVNTDDWEQVQALAKNSQGRVMSVEELKKIKEEKGEKQFRIWLIP